MLKRNDMILRGRYNFSTYYKNILDIAEVDDYIDQWHNREGCNVSLLINMSIIDNMRNIVGSDVLSGLYPDETVYKYFIKKKIMIILMYVAPDIYEVQLQKVLI